MSGGDRPARRRRARDRGTAADRRRRRSAREVGLLAAIAAIGGHPRPAHQDHRGGATVTPGEPVRLLGGLVYFSLIRNPGAAFSMATGMTWLLALVAIGVVIVIIRMAPRLRSTPWAVVARAGAGRGDRQPDRPDLPRRPASCRGTWSTSSRCSGRTREYFPVFNVADSAITIGGISLVITALLGIDFDGTHPQAKKTPRTTVPDVRRLPGAGRPGRDAGGRRAGRGCSGMSRTTVADHDRRRRRAGRRRPGRPVGKAGRRTAGWRSPCPSRTGRRWWCRRPSTA